MMINLAFAIISSLVWILLAAYAGSAKRDFLHPAVVFSLLFAVSYPIKLTLSFYGFHVLNSMAVDDDIVLASIVIFNVAGFAFVSPLLAQEPVLTTPRAFRLNAFSIYLLLTFAFLLLIASHGINSVSAIFSREALISRITERGNERIGSGLTALLSEVGSFFLIVFAIKLAGQRALTRIFLWVFVIIYAWLALFITGSKYETLFLPTIVFICFYYERRMQGVEILSFKRITAGFSVLLMLIGLTGYLRGHGGWTGADYHPFMLQSFYQLINAFDAPDNLIVLLNRMGSWFTGDMGLALPRDYLVFQFIPRVVWAGKPIIQGNQLVMQNYFPERFSGAAGEVISPSFPGEMMLTGGVIYMIIYSLVLGVGVRWIYQRSQNRGGLYFVAYLWILVNIFNFLRSGTGAVGSFFLFMVVAIAIQSIVNLISIVIDRAKVQRKPQ